MRKYLLVIIFGMLVAGNIEAQTDNRLNGTWVGVTEGVDFELILRNGNFEEKYYGESFRRGAFTANGRELTITPTNIHGGGFNKIMSPFGIDFGLESKWYTFNEAIIAIRNALLRLGLSEREANEFVQIAITSDDQTSQYSVDDNTLILVSTAMGQTITIILTRE